MLVRALDGEVPCRLALRIELRPDSRVIRLQRAVRSIGRTNALFGKSNEYPQVIKLPSTRASTRCRPESGLPSRQNSRSSARFSECFERRHDSHPAAPRGVAGNVRFQLRERCFCALREWLVWVGLCRSPPSWSDSLYCTSMLQCDRRESANSGPSRHPNLGS